MCFCFFFLVFVFFPSLSKIIMETAGSKKRRHFYTEEEDAVIEHWVANPPAEVKHLSARSYVFWDKVLELEPSAFQRTSNSLASRYAMLHPLPQREARVVGSDDEEPFVPEEEDEIEDENDEPVVTAVSPPPPRGTPMDADVAAFIAFGKMTGQLETIKREEQTAATVAVSAISQCNAAKAILQKAAEQEMRSRKAVAEAEAQFKAASENHAQQMNARSISAWSEIVRKYMLGDSQADKEWNTFRLCIRNKEAARRAVEQARAALEAAVQVKREAQSSLDAKLNEQKRLSTRVDELRLKIAQIEKEVERLTKQLSACSSVEHLLAQVAKQIRK